MRAFGYVRISKLDEGTTSPQRQRQAVKRWCDERAMELVETFEDLDLSAYNKRIRRPGYEQMLARLSEVDTIICWRLDRLVRTVTGFAKLLERLEATSTKMATTDGAVDMTSAAGRFVTGIIAGAAELEAATTSERARAMHAFKKERGEWVGRVPFGWTLDGKHLTLNPDEFKVIEEVAERYVAGESMRRIAVDVGITHPNLSRMLRTERVLEALRPSLRPRLVAELAERGRNGTRAKRSMLGGIARCGVCEGRMTVVGQSQGWAAYSCKERGHVSISRNWLDAYVSGQVLDAIDTGKLLKRIEKSRRRRRTLTSSEIEARIELLERDYYEGQGWTRERYLARREGLLRQLQAARRSENDEGIDLAPELARNLPDRWLELSLHGQRKIVAAVMDHIEVERATSHGRIDSGRVRLVWR